MFSDPVMKNAFRVAVLAKALAERIAGVLPSPMECWEDEGSLVFYDGRHASAFGVPDEAYETYGVLATAQQLLDQLQDYVTIELRTPWPVDTVGQQGHPFCEIKGDVLDCGYRAADDWLVRLGPIRLDDLRGRSAEKASQQ